MTRLPDISGHCFTGAHDACRFDRCRCLCHDELFAEPGPYPAVPAYKEPTMPTDRSLIGAPVEIQPTVGFDAARVATQEGDLAFAMSFRLKDGRTPYFAMDVREVKGMLADIDGILDRWPGGRPF